MAPRPSLLTVALTPSPVGGATADGSHVLVSVDGRAGGVHAAARVGRRGISIRRRARRAAHDRPVLGVVTVWVLVEAHSARITVPHGSWPACCAFAKSFDSQVR
jgi:hypothetical protein